MSGLGLPAFNSRISSNVFETETINSALNAPEVVLNLRALPPGERARMLLKFEDFTGKYVYHCHILEHEDMAVMRNYEIRI